MHVGVQWMAAVLDYFSWCAQLENVLAEAVARYSAISAWSTQGSFMWHHMNDSIHWSIQGLAGHDEETLRPTCFLTYSDAFQRTAAFKAVGLDPKDDELAAKHSVAFCTVAANAIRHGLCDVFPEGTVAGCGTIAEGKQPEFRLSRGDGYWANTAKEQEQSTAANLNPCGSYTILL